MSIAEGLSEVAEVGVADRHGSLAHVGLAGIQQLPSPFHSFRAQIGEDAVTILFFESELELKRPNAAIGCKNVAPPRMV